MLFPLAVLFRLVVAARRALYRHGVLAAARLPVPVIVVGNISVGGTGKTPLTLWLIEYLRAQGYRPGVVSRGYGGTVAMPQAVGIDSVPGQVGDEPVLIARRAGCPVWVGRDRVAAARALLQAHPEVDLLLSDDGLQHYRLARDLEIAVVDGRRGLGNGLLLPAGPLREPRRRLATVDLVVVNDAPPEGAAGFAQHTYPMQLAGSRFANLADTVCSVGTEAFAGSVVHAVAGIGNPRRFFDHLRQLGIHAVEHPFPDHYAYHSSDFPYPDTEVVLMTEKDAVKCRQFARPHWWALAVEAQLQPEFGNRLLEKLRARNGSKAA